MSKVNMVGVVLGAVMLAFPACVLAGPTGIEISGNVKMTNGGSIVFPDGSTQATATVRGPQGIPSSQENNQRG